jgi:1-acyl-sn-glycerol-3-phosphate acyltransferase
MKTKKETIHKFSIRYFLLKAYESFAFRRFYKHIQVIGGENVPFGKQYILAPNHQNALMDALGPHYAHPGRVVFFARADIFKKSWQSKILRALKILPIYRIRDGASELSKNEEIFQSAITILGDHIPIAIMPEGNHGKHRKLRMLVKGIFRIAFRAQEETKPEDGVKIVPVGIDYSHYEKFFQDLLIIYGPPIEVSEYMELFKENGPKGINALRDRLASEMKKIMIHIENDELYMMYDILRKVYNPKMRKKVGIVGKSHYDRFRAEKQMIRILDEKFTKDPERLRKLSEKVIKYQANLKKLNLRNWIFERSGFTTPKLIYKRIGLYLSSPLFLYGLINNWLPFWTPTIPVKNIKDRQFHSSVKFVLAMILFPVFYGIQTLLVAIFTGPTWIAIAYLLSLPLFGYFSFFWHIWHKRWRAGLKYRKMKKSRDPKILELENLYHEIMNEMDGIVDEGMRK